MGLLRLAFDEGRHSWDGEGDDSVIWRVDEAFGDQIRADRAEAGWTTSQPGCDFAR